MSSKWLFIAGLGLGLFGCASDDGGGAGGGDDTLPKRGEMASDPTIVSATAKCSTCDSEECIGLPDGPPPTNDYVRVHVNASDPMGDTNLGTCAGMLSNISDEDTYSDGSGSSSACNMFFKLACTAGQVHTVRITVANETGGVTTASVKLTVAP